jgi:hypothetical protein
MRHRPFGMAGPWQAEPRRVFDPQRAQPFLKSPGGLPFFQHPLRQPLGSSVIIPRVAPGLAPSYVASGFSLTRA